MRFVRVCFHPADRKTFTYEIPNGFDVAIGDRVEVDTPRSGRTFVEVVGLTDDQPAFQCKPILSVAPRVAAAPQT